MDTPLLIRGERGSGKKLFARTIHRASLRNKGPFITVNCGAIPYDMFESELLGSKEKPGMITLAQGGTIFLDEIAQVPLNIQFSLLQVMQEKSLRYDHLTEGHPVNVRFIAASHRDLETLILKEQFRPELYYLLNAISVHMPALREHSNDMLDLVQLFLKEFNHTYSKEVTEVDSKVIKLFSEYYWSGNVRELKNTIESLVVLAEKNCIFLEDLPNNFLLYAPNFKVRHKRNTLNNAAVEAEQKLILQTLDKVQGNRSNASRLLGIPRSTLYYKLRKLGISTKHIDSK